MSQKWNQTFVKFNLNQFIPNPLQIYTFVQTNLFISLEWQKPLKMETTESILRTEDALEILFSIISLFAFHYLAIALNLSNWNIMQTIWIEWDIDRIDSPLKWILFDAKYMSLNKQTNCNGTWDDAWNSSLFELIHFNSS